MHFDFSLSSCILCFIFSDILIFLCIVSFIEICYFIHHAFSVRLLIFYCFLFSAPLVISFLTVICLFFSLFYICIHTLMCAYNNICHDNNYLSTMLGFLLDIVD